MTVLMMKPARSSAVCSGPHRSEFCVLGTMCSKHLTLS